KKRAAPRAKKVTIARGKKVARGKESKMQKKPGGSNVGRYKKVAKGKFCGPAGGAPEGSYPVNTKKRARAALAYARNAPNPEGIKRCVRKKFPSMGKKAKKS
ncbi:MAG: hypothetical protein PVF65_12590, partial [Sphingomonadales bacterium]